MDGLVELWITDDVVIVPVKKDRRKRALKSRTGKIGSKSRSSLSPLGRPADLNVYMVLPALRALFSLALVLGTWPSHAQLSARAQRSGPGPAERITAEEYIDQWKPVAMEKMKQHGIPASITLAQGLLESSNGNSELAREANNHFGIKCTNDWDGGKSFHDDDKRHECFRKYRDAADSFEDHSRFLQRPRYAGLFELRTTDYKGWAHGLKKAGYATDPRYPQKLIDLIERYQLYKLDEGVDIAYTPPLPGAAKRPAGRTDANEGAEITIGGGRTVELFDGRIKFVNARSGDTYRSLAEELQMMPGQIARYNDADREAAIREGQVVFLQPKRNKARDTAVHMVAPGETLWDIAQAHGVKLAKLAAYNGLSADAPLSAGQHVLLRKPKR
jgi:LysM repeat protein